MKQIFYAQYSYSARLTVCEIAKQIACYANISELLYSRIAVCPNMQETRIIHVFFYYYFDVFSPSSVWIIIYYSSSNLLSYTKYFSSLQEEMLNDVFSVIFLSR
jgi:hypothetical protein